MNTLFIKNGKELLTIILNTDINNEVTDRIINDYLDTYLGCDWWISEGWEI